MFELKIETLTILSVFNGVNNKKILHEMFIKDLKSTSHNIKFLERKVYKCRFLLRNKFILIFVQNEIGSLSILRI